MIFRLHLHLTGHDFLSEKKNSIKKKKSTLESKTCNPKVEVDGSDDFPIQTGDS